MATRLSTGAYRRLRTLPALRGLAGVDRERVATLFREQLFRKGDVIFHEGDPGVALYIVHAGALEAHTGGQTIARFGPGEWFGEMALITGAKRSATVEVVLDCHLLTLDAAAFTQLLAIHPALYEEMATILSTRLAATSHGSRLWHTCQIVFVDNRGDWPDRRAIVESLATRLEQELGREVAIVTILASDNETRVATRAGRPDSVLAGGRRALPGLRERVAKQLAVLAGRVPVVLVEVEGRSEARPALASLADALVVLACDATPSDDQTAPVSEDSSAGAPYEKQRRLTLHHRCPGATPAVASATCAVLDTDPRASERTLGRVARWLTRRTVGVALGSGVAYGLAHVGVLAVLEEAGIPIDCVAGSSIGALVGAGYALGMTAPELRERCERLVGLRTLRTLIPTAALLARDLNLMRPGILDGARLLALLDSLSPLPDPTFADLVVPFRAVATDLETGARVELSAGRLMDAVRASASAPWLLSPCRVGDRILIDGGMSDPVPATTVRAMGADLVIAVNVVPPLDPVARNPFERALGALDWLNPLSYVDRRRHLPNSFDVVMKALLILQHELGNGRANEADVLITPALGRFWFLDFWNAPALIAKGKEAAEAALPAIREKRRVRCGVTASATG